jgi:predicted ArsR family transcriptional regulator
MAEESTRSQPPAPTGRRLAVLSMLRESSVPMDVTEIAERLGVHVNTVRFHLEALVADGRVERLTSAPVGPGRPALTFRAHPGMDPAGPRNYRLLAGILADSLATEPDPAARAVEIGRAWGSREGDAGSTEVLSDQATVARLVAVMDGLGFAPQVRPEPGPIGLRHCPFLDLVDTRAAVICPLHLGLLQGMVSRWPTSVTVEALEPFAEPDLCLVHLGRAPDPAS